MRSIQALGYAFIGFCLGLFLLTYSPYDASWWYRTSVTQEIQNYGGLFGAQCAAALTVIFGGAAWFLVAASSLMAWAFWYDHDENDTMRMMTGVMGTTMVFAAIFQEYGLCDGGGLLGSGLLKIVTYAVGPFRVELCLWMVSTLSIVVFCGVAWVRPLIVRVSQQMLLVREWLMTRIGASMMLPREAVPQMVPASSAEHASVPQGDEDVSLRKVRSEGKKGYKKPSRALFATQGDQTYAHDNALYDAQARVLEHKLAQFGIKGKVTGIVAGPVVILYEYQPESSVPLTKIIAREYDLILALRVVDMRILAPIPGKSVVGFECPREQRMAVRFGDLYPALTAAAKVMRLPLVMGTTTTGAPHVVDLAGLPHMLVAGTTGSGKSVALHTMLMSILCEMRPDQVRLILIDPKRLEFAWYAHIPHLLVPVVTDARHAIEILRWAVKEMERRYETMAQAGVRDRDAYAALGHDEMPYLVIMIDEWADLMMTGGRDVEGLVVRIAQMARAAGIHLILATQRPSVDVITGLIKVNIPARAACKVISKVDSRTILDGPGAEKLLGRGDMLWLESGMPLQRLHGAYVASDEIQAVVAHIKTQAGSNYVTMQQQEVAGDAMPQEDAALYEMVVSYLQTVDEVSISQLQRKFRIGYNRSARMIDYLEARGMLLSLEGNKMKKVVR